MTKAKKKVAKLHAVEKQEEKQVAVPTKKEMSVLEQLFYGKIKPPIQVVDYLLEQYKDARAELELTSRSYKQLRDQLNEMQKKILVLSGGMNKYGEDIGYWMDQSNKESEK